MTRDFRPVVPNPASKPDEGPAPTAPAEAAAVAPKLPDVAAATAKSLSGMRKAAVIGAEVGKNGEPPAGK